MVWRFRGLSITQRLFALTLLALLPAAAVVTYYILALHQQREREVHALALQYGQMASLEMERIVSGVEGVLHVLSYAPVVRDFETQACNQLLGEVSTGLPQLLGIGVADAEGVVRCSVPVTEGLVRIDERPFFAEAMEGGGLVVGEFTRSRIDETPSIPLALAIRGGAGQIVGVIVTGFDLDWLGERLQARTLLEGSSLTVADRNGVIIAREPFPEQFVGTRIPDEFLHLVRARNPGSLAVLSQDGSHRVIGYYPPAYTGTGLYVSYGVSRDMAFASVYAATYRSIAIALAGAMAVFLVAWAIGNRLFRRPIDRLLATIKAWRLGDDTARTGIRGQDELAMLAAAIDEYMDDLVVDRAARRQAEQHRDLLVRELDHRVKNILTTVQAVAAQSFKGSEDQQAFQVFAGRLATMAAAHKLLTAENWRNAELRRTLEVALGPFEEEGRSRFSLTGPPLSIRARAALALSMAVHELSTNAVKYGALSAEGGSVAIAWSIERKPEGDDAFRLEWRESGGPPVVATGRKGFGTVMIERALAAELSADVQIDFAPAGLFCRVRCAVASLAPEEDEADSEPVAA